MSDDENERGGRRRRKRHARGGGGDQDLPPDASSAPSSPPVTVKENVTVTAKKEADAVGVVGGKAAVKDKEDVIVSKREDTRVVSTEKGATDGSKKEEVLKKEPSAKNMQAVKDDDKGSRNNSSTRIRQTDEEEDRESPRRKRKEAKETVEVEKKPEVITDKHDTPAAEVDEKTPKKEKKRRKKKKGDNTDEDTEEEVKKEKEGEEEKEKEGSGKRRKRKKGENASNNGLGAGLQDPGHNTTSGENSPTRRTVAERLLATRRGFTQFGGEGNRPKAVGERIQNLFGYGISMLTNAGLKPLESENEEIRPLINFDLSSYGMRPITQLTIHEVTSIEEDLLLRHPLVRVHFVDATTGKYLSKSDRSEHASHYNEASTGLISSDGTQLPSRTRVSTPFLLPQLTSAKPLRDREFVKWDEKLIWNERYQTLLSRRVIIFFEILDFGGLMTPENVKNGGGFYPVAWAYIRAVSAGGDVNITPEKVLKLQLYKYQETDSFVTKSKLRAMGIGSSHEEYPTPVVFLNYMKRDLIRYKGLLKVTVSPIPSPEPTAVRLRATNPCEKEVNTLELDRLGDIKDEGGIAATGAGTTEKDLSDTQKRALLRIREDYKPCLLPDSLLLKISAGPMGATVIKLSYSGRYLAAGCADGHLYPLRIIDIEKGIVIHSFEGHHGLIHSVTWAPNDRSILTASADGTAKLWSLGTVLGGEVEGLEISLDHKPKTYVYDAQFHPTESLIVTGSFDRKVRLWRYDLSKRTYRLLGNIQSDKVVHEAHINAVLWDKKGERLFVADGVGMLNQWRCSGPPDDLDSYSFIRTINFEDLSGKYISSISLHPITQNQMLVLADYHTLMMVDLRTFKVLQNYMGVEVSDNLIKSAFSPDGKFVISGSENGQLCCWNSKTGVKQGEKIWSIRYGKPLLGVDWSQTEHLIALCSYGEDCPILMYTHEHTSIDERSNEVDTVIETNSVSRKDDDSIFGRSRIDDESSIASSLDRTPLRSTRHRKDRRTPLSGTRERSVERISEDGTSDDEFNRTSKSERRRQRNFERSTAASDNESGND